VILEGEGYGSKVNINGRCCMPILKGLGLALDAGLLSRVSNRQPSGSSVGAVLGPCIESNRRAWGSLMNSVDDGFKTCKAPRWQADAGSDYNTIIARRD
jgi:hypothetical protein